jgi:hypothetical protein
MTARRRNIAALVTAAVVSAGLPAAAADDLVVIEAKQRMAEGKDLYGAGQYEAAWLKYKQACVVLKSDNCTRGLAFTEFKSKRWLDAYQHMRELLLPAPKPSLTPPMVDELSRMMREAYAKTGHIGVRADPGATLALDGSPLLVSPSDALDVLPGKHVVEASHLGRTRRLEVNAAEGTVVDADLTIPGPILPIAIEPLAASAPQSVAGPEPPPRTSGQPPDTSGAPRGFWTTKHVMLIGLGVGAVGAGIVTGYFFADGAATDNEAKDLTNDTSCSGSSTTSCTRASQLKSRYDTDQVGGGVALGLGAALLVSAVVALIAWPEVRTGNDAWLTPLGGPGLVGVELGKHF